MQKFKLKPYQLYFGAIFMIVTVAVVVSKIAVAPSKLNPSPSASAIPKSKFSNLPQGISNQSADITYNTTLETPPPLPQSLPVLQASSFTTQDIVSQLKTSFNLGEPKYIKQGTYEKYSWANNHAELTYDPTNSSVLFVNPDSPEGKAPSAEEAQTQALQYINSHFSINSQLQLLPIKTRFINASKTVVVDAPSPQQANMVEIEFQFQIDGKPLMLPPYERPNVLIYLNNQGVRKLRYTIPPLISVSPDNIKPSPLKDAVNIILANQGIIIKEDADQISDAAPLFDVSKINITDISIGYLYKDTLIPVYLFTGKAPSHQHPDYMYTVTIAAPAVK